MFSFNEVQRIFFSFINHICDVVSKKVITKLKIALVISYIIF